MSEIRMRDRYDDDILLKSLGEESSNTTGPAKEFRNLPETCLAKVIVTQVSGSSPTLDLKIQGSDDNENWEDVIILPQITGAGKEEIPLGPQEWRYYRYSSTIGGSESPSFTYLFYLSC